LTVVAFARPSSAIPESWKGRKTCDSVRRAMNDRLRRLMEEARKVAVSDDDLEQQRVSFAYGNASIGNERVTLETVERALGQLRGEDAGNRLVD